MAATELLKQLGTSITGNIDKAKIIIFDERGDNLTKGTLNHEGILNTAKLNLSNLPSPSPPSPAVKRIFSVQFNPSELSLYSSAVPNLVSDVQANDNQDGSEVKRITLGSMDMTVPLIFDKTVNADAFFEEKRKAITDLPTASGLTSAVAGIKKAAGKDNWSVQPIVEAFIAVLRFKETRSIVFVWDDFEFFGKLKHISAQYTMFSTSGTPIRAKVVMRIRLLSELSYWDDIFKSGAFGQKGLTNLAPVNTYMLNVNV